MPDQRQIADLRALRAEVDSATADAKSAEYCDDVTATMPGGVLSRAWERRDRAVRALAEAEGRS